MFGSVILDVAIGLVLVYLLLSLVATSIREWFASLLKTRATTLHEGIVEMFGDAKLVDDLYNHPVINSLYRGASVEDARKARQLPSYIPARSFSTALVDMIVKGRDTVSALQAASEGRTVTVESVRAEIGRIQNVRVQRAVLAAVDSANGDMNALKRNLEQWFDGTMDRVSGWYKHHTQLYLFWIGLVLALVADADTIRIARRLYVDPAQREAAVAIAVNVNKSDTVGASVAKVAGDKLEALGMPLTGWTAYHLDLMGSPIRSLGIIGTHAQDAWFGWLLTALAISLGAPFWFDTLGRIMVIRNTVKPAQKSPNEASVDRQTDGGGGSNPPPPPPAPVALMQAEPVPIAGASRDATALPNSGNVVHEWASGDPQEGLL